MSEHHNTAAEHPHGAATHVAPPPLLAMSKERKFAFRKVVTENKELGVKTESKREPVKLEFSIPTDHGLVAAINTDPKVLEYVLALVEDAVVAAVRTQLDEEVAPGLFKVNNQSELDLTKLTIQYLANEPKSDRRGRGIPKELWEAFAQDYIAIMPAAIDKPVEKVAAAAGFFVKRLQPVKSLKPVLRLLQEYLDTWAVTTTEMEQFSEIYEFLKEKVDTFLNVNEETLLSNL